MGEAVASVLGTILVFVLIMVGLMVGVNALDDHMDREVTKTCQERYGEDWQGNSSAYNPDVCVNSNGDVKYLQ